MSCLTTIWATRSATVGTPKIRWPPVFFGNGDGAHRWRKVASRTHPVPKLVEIVPQVGIELLDRLPIHTGRARIGFDRFVSLVHLLLCNIERLVCLSYVSASFCFQLFRPNDRLTRSLRSSPITEPSSLLRIGPPQYSASVLSPRGFRRLCFSLAIGALVPAVPRKSLHPTHAPSTPVAICPVIRPLTDLSQKGYTPLVLATPIFLTTRLRWVHFRSSFGCTPARGLALSFCSNAHHHGSLPQQLGVV